MEACHPKGEEHEVNVGEDVEVAVTHIAKASGITTKED